ncbi:MAG: hypothetical protein GX838_03570 [Clostridiaceae bacterium]|nr:hypothetical protein [Clostridiaceae bacterium]
MKRFAAVILGIIVIISGAGCQVGEPDSEPDQNAAETLATATLPPPSEESPADTIRVAIRPEDDFHPLFPKHYATFSLLQLVYETLFDVTYDGRLEGVLAGSYRWSPDGLECWIGLEEDHYFHNGQAVTAEDARASLEQYLAFITAGEVDNVQAGPLNSFFQFTSFSGLERWRLQGYQNIHSSRVSEEGDLVITLNKADPLLPRLLLFPIVPESAAKIRSMNPPAGSGEWQVESYSAGGLVLAREGDGSVRRIEALVYPTAVEAAYGFDQGEIDLLLMDPSETALYADRSRIRKQRLEDGGYISLFFNDRQGGALTNRDALLYVLGADPELASMAAPFAYAGYPVFRGDFRLGGTAIPPVSVIKMPEGFGSTDSDTLDDEAGKPVTPDRPSFNLLVPQGLVPASLIDRLSTAFLKINRKLIVHYIEADDWQSALSQGRYDAALLVDVARFFPDPADYLDGLHALGLFSWTGEGGAGDQAVLQQARLVSLELTGRLENNVSSTAYAGSIFRTFESLPVAGLAATGTMVWYSIDVEGTMAGTWRKPYRGVEDLLVWRR